MGGCFLSTAVFLALAVAPLRVEARSAAARSAGAVVGELGLDVDREHHEAAPTLVQTGADISQQVVLDYVPAIPNWQIAYQADSPTDRSGFPQPHNSVPNESHGSIINDNLHTSIDAPQGHGPPNEFSGADPSESDNGGSHMDGNHVQSSHFHGYLALAFLLGSLAIGCVLQVVQERFLTKIPYTTMLFLTGFALAWVHEARSQKGWMDWTTWFISVDLWTAINPHLIFFIFLPALTFAEAIKINVKMGRTVFSQVTLLACPGMLLSGVLTAIFAYYCFPYGWSWPTAFVFGAILSATDPVAVASLFNTLGVSQRLTTLITGECLLNDSTAIIFFTLMMKVMLGSPVTFGYVILFLVDKTLFAVVFGCLSASLLLVCVAWCAESNYNSDMMIQFVFTVLCSFLTFFLAEVDVTTNGVLAVVSAGTVFAYVAWPRFVCREAICTLWEAIAFVSRTVIFMVSGLLFGSRVASRGAYLNWSDLGYLVLLYVALTLFRAIMVLVCWPALNYCGPKVSWHEALVVVWGGMRGSVGLILAIVMDLEPTVNAKIGSEVMFHVGGIALLCSVVNSTSLAPLLSWLRLIQIPEIEEQTLLHFEKLTQEHTRTSLDDLVTKEDPLFAGASVDIVQTLVPSLSVTTRKELARPTIEVTARLQVYRQTFMRAVRHHYWKDIEGGLIPRTSRVARVLLYSTDDGVESSKYSLCDWDAVQNNISDRQALPRMNKLSAVWPLNHISPLQQLFPSGATVMMWKVYASVAFIEAHRAAQEEVPKRFGKENPLLGAQVQEQIARESNAECDKATALLQTLPPAAVEAGKSRMLAGRVLQEKLAKVNQFQEEGMLSNAAAGDIRKDLYQARYELAFTLLRAPSNQASKHAPVDQKEA